MGGAGHLEERATALQRENAELRRALSEANARIAGLASEVARLSEQVTGGDERLSELLAIAQRKSRSPPPKVPREQKAPAHLTSEQRERLENRPKAPLGPRRKRRPRNR